MSFWCARFKSTGYFRISGSLIFFLLEVFTLGLNFAWLCSFPQNLYRVTANISRYIWNSLLKFKIKKRTFESGPWKPGTKFQQFTRGHLQLVLGTFIKGDVIWWCFNFASELLSIFAFDFLFNTLKMHSYDSLIEIGTLLLKTVLHKG